MKSGGEKLKKSKKRAGNSAQFLAEKIIENALNLYSTDVHIEPRENSTLVRFRINGALRTVENLDAKISNKLVDYFKNLAELDLREKNFAQQKTILHGDTKIRISTTPVLLGEKITLRIIRADKKIRSLEEIGLWGENLRQVRQALRQPQGVIITVGEGVNTTNFSLLNEIKSDEKNIITVERQIEKTIPEINQTFIKPKIGLNYPQLLKSALSQNPDVILIDQVLDAKTAEMAFEAAMRGKLVIMSLPVQKTSQVIPFLEYLGVKNFILSVNLLAIIGQKLVRTATPSHLNWQKINKSESAAILNEFEIDAKKLHQFEKSFAGKKLNSDDKSILRIPTIKAEIGELGYTSMTGIFEVISLIDGKFGNDFKNLISSSPNSAEIEEFLLENNFTNLKIDGLIKALGGKTSLKEIMCRTGY